mmetsp:Transcript_35461/g.52068  ORF Transcript_35461/g.52068 Transcript_35461/m.52068 type:complete len:213 (+) Transcript_35461:2912-3550(+)
MGSAIDAVRGIFHLHLHHHCIHHIFSSFGSDCHFHHAGVQERDWNHVVLDEYRDLRGRHHLSLGLLRDFHSVAYWHPRWPDNSRVPGCDRRRNRRCHLSSHECADSVHDCNSSYFCGYARRGHLASCVSRRKPTNCQQSDTNSTWRTRSEIGIFCVGVDRERFAKLVGSQLAGCRNSRYHFELGSSRHCGCGRHCVAELAGYQKENGIAASR